MKKNIYRVILSDGWGFFVPAVNVVEAAQKLAESLYAVSFDEIASIIQ